MSSMYLYLTTLLRLLSLTCAHTTRRRLLHNPFFLPATTTTVSEPPPPPETETPLKYPFFPSYPSPPEPSSFASFPANISSLSLPESLKKGKSVSPTLLAVTLISVVIAVLTVIAAVLFYCRRREHYLDDKTVRSSSESNRLCSDAVSITSTNRNKHNRSTTSSEFLYLGTLVDDFSPTSSIELQDIRKMDSPELHPLPPLVRPLIGSQSGSASGRLLANTAGPDITPCVSNSSSPCSSSNSGSPAPSMRSPPTPPSPPPLIARDCETTRLSPPSVAKPNYQIPNLRPHMVSSPNQENMVLDPKKSQNIAISLRALNLTIDKVCEAIIEGNAATLGTELLECLLKMAPTKEEERKLKEYKDDSPLKLGTAEIFLRKLLDIPFAFKRVDVMLYMANFENEVEYLKRSFETLEIACEELRNSRIFFKLLEAVLKTGNRMNVGTNSGDAHAFKLDTLLKLADLKGTDGKTTVLHFVVQEIIKSEGARLFNDNQYPKYTLNEDAKCRKLGLHVISSLSSELSNVKKSAAIDSNVLTGDVIKLLKVIGHIREVTESIEEPGSHNINEKFSRSMNVFINMAEEEIIRIQAEESVALSLVKEITEYFHGDSAKEEAHPLRIFMIVKDFLSILDRVCKDVGMINEHTLVSSAHKFPVPVNPTLCTSPHEPEFEKMQQGSSDEESLMIAIDL